MSDMSNPPSAASAEPAAAFTGAGAGEFTDLRGTPNYDLLAAVPIRLSVEVGSASLSLANLLTLGEGSIVELDRATDELLDLFANGTLLAKGEIVEVGKSYGIRIAEIVAPEHRLDNFERRK
jgi:flagellar motor switch protein FliN